MASSSAHAHPDPDAFAADAFTSAPETVDCTLENGEAAQCHRFTVRHAPEALEIGPFCPATLDDEGGLWDWDGQGAGLYRIDRAFLERLADLGYRFYDEDGEVSVVDIRTERPDTDHACLTASADESVTMTMLLPVRPVMADAPSELGTVAKVGVALDGVPIFADAPSVLDTGHMPALDVCGGHIDPGGWYHWHATSTDIATVLDEEGVAADCANVEQDASAPFGYAFDGYPMFGSREADGSMPEGLDACGGHVGPTATGETYHYHGAETFPNLPPCLVGVVAEGNFTTTAAQGIGSAGAGPGGTSPGFEDAAATLGVEPDALVEALGGSGGQPDLAGAAAALGIDENALREALPPPPGR